MACTSTSGTMVAGSLETIFLHSLTIAPSPDQVTDAVVTYKLIAQDDLQQAMSGSLSWDGSVTADPETGAPITGAYISYNEDTTPLTPGRWYWIEYTANGSLVPTENGNSRRAIQAT